MPKVIVIAAFTYAVYARPVGDLLLQRFYLALFPRYYHFWVNVTDDDLENSYIFDNKT